MREPIRVALEEVEFVRRLGVEVRTETEIGADVAATALLTEYDAVFVAAGMGRVPDLGVPGEGHPDVTEVLSFIAETKLAEKDGLERLVAIPIGSEVMVVGAGNTAIDAATIAKRLGAERVVIVYRRSQQEMPAYDFEYTFIKNEGVEFRFLTQPIEVLTDGDRVTGLKCVTMELGDPEPDGRRRPRPLADSEFVLPCDQAIMAIGQEKRTPLPPPCSSTSSSPSTAATSGSTSSSAPRIQRY